MTASILYLFPLGAAMIAARGAIRLDVDRSALAALGVAMSCLCLATISAWPGPLVPMAFAFGTLALVRVLARSSRSVVVPALGGLGALANLVPIAVHGAMPVRSGARRILSDIPASEPALLATKHREVDASPVMWLADHIPVAVPGLAAVVSPGDLVLVVAFVVLGLDQRRTRRGSRPGVRHRPTCGSPGRARRQPGPKQVTSETLGS